MRRNVLLFLLPLIGAALALPACKRPDKATDSAVAQTRDVDQAPSETHPVSDDNLNAVLWMQRSEEYQALTEQTYRAAAGHLDEALEQEHWDALVPDERGNPFKGLKPAVVMDVDETVLDNSPYQARLVRNGKEYDKRSWDAWVAEKKAKAIPGAVAFARAATAKGITVLYVSNRAEHLHDRQLQPQQRL